MLASPETGEMSHAGGPASAADRTSNLALLDAKLARYGSAPAAPELAANSLYQPTLQAPNMGYAPHLAAAPFSANGTGEQSLHHKSCCSRCDLHFTNGLRAVAQVRSTCGQVSYLELGCWVPVDQSCPQVLTKPSSPFPSAPYHLKMTSCQVQDLHCSRCAGRAR